MNSDNKPRYLCNDPKALAFSQMVHAAREGLAHSIGCWNSNTTPEDRTARKKKNKAARKARKKNRRKK